MGIQKQDPEYLRAKYAFTRDLIQFHESRGTGLQCDPKINGKEVDLYLLYQIVTSHGGWEKINLRNEWDKLLEHFHLPRSTNGGLAIKQIYLRYLELYEKIHYLGEDVDSKEEPDDEYEDFRGRRRYPNKLSSSHHYHHHHHHHSSSSYSHSNHQKEITDQNRSQLGLSSRLLESSDYDGLLLSLQSPLPNEQDMAISVCTLLSNETKHVLRFSKSPAILNMLLAHAGIYQDCGMRTLMEESYQKSRDMNYADFWDEVLRHSDTRQLLCECFIKRMNESLGLLEDEGAILSRIKEVEDGDLPEEEKFSVGTALRLRLGRLRQSREPPALPPDPLVEEEEDSPSTSCPCGVSKETQDTDASKETQDTDASKETQNSAEVVEEVAEACQVDKTNVEEPSCNSEEKEKKLESEVEVTNDPAQKCNDKAEEDSEICISLPPVKTEEIKICCSSCPCRRETVNKHQVSDEEDVSIQWAKEDQVKEDKEEEPISSLPFSMRRTQNSGDKVGQRICQIAHILRNLSFEQDNALVMSSNPTLMRFLLVSANCTFSSLAQTSFDIIGNIASHLRLEEPFQDPLSSMFLTLVTSGVFSSDRFKILRSLEAIRELVKVEGNESIITRYIESRVYRRMCDLLTLSDIMLLIYTLECILSMTGLGEAVCDEIVRVQGSVATLVSLVTVEAQSYGPKGCILMRVVETVTGATTSSSQPSSSAPSPTPPISQGSSQPQQQQTVAAATSQPVIAPTQHLLQQQLQQPPNPIYSPVTTLTSTSSVARPSPSNSPGIKMVTGTTVVPPVVQGQVGALPISQTQPGSKSVNVPGQQFPPSSNIHTSQMFNLPIPSSPYIANHLSSPISCTQASFVPSNAIPPKTNALPIPENPAIRNGNAIVNVPAGAASHSLPPGATTVVIQQPNANAASVVCSGNIQPVATAVNGVPSLVTANLPQISNHNLSQHHVVTPSISLVTPRGTLSEEAWAIAWLKGTFESASGTSIEQGEIYRLYSGARKNPNVVLSLEQFVQCVKCAYGASVGPVIKQFGGGTSLSFFEGIKPKISIRAVGTTPASAVQLQAATLKAMGGAGGNTVVAAVTNPQHLQVPVTSGAPTIIASSLAQTLKAPIPAVISTPVSLSQVEGEAMVHLDSNVNSSNKDANNTDEATNPVSVHIPSREAKPSLSPILQATLSQPPKAKNSSTNCSVTGSSRCKATKKKDVKQSAKQKKGNISAASAGNVLTGNLQSPLSPPSSMVAKGNSSFSTASSAIRSLLASKVAQRQQNKLHQQLPKNSKGMVNDKGCLPYNASSKEDLSFTFSSSEVVKVNGVGPDGSLDKIEESSASSSLLSSDGSDNSGVNKGTTAITSFHGVLHNGQANLDTKNEPASDGTEECEHGGKNRGNMKGMLIDLLERRVPSREPVNGIVAGREIRISEKGLELIENMEESLAVISSGSALVNHNNSTCPSSDVQESQKMTFYSSTSDAQVTLQGQASSATCVIPASAVGSGLSGSTVTLASGGATSVPSTNSTALALRPGGQQVKISSGKIVRVIEHAGVPLCAPTIATATSAATPSTAIAEVQPTAVPSSAAAAFCRGDGLVASFADTTPANGEVAYVVDDSGQSTMIVDVVGSVFGNADSVALDTGSSGDGTGGGGSQNLFTVDGEGISAAAAQFSNDSHIENHGTAESISSNLGSSIASGGDLLEKFSQFSDLIVVPPEQLASLKRPSSPLPTTGTASVVPGNNNNDSAADDLPPAAKKQVLDIEIPQDGEDYDQVPLSGITIKSVSSLSVPGMNTQLQHNSITTAVVTNNNSVTTAVQAMATGAVTTTSSALPPGAGAQVVQLPLRLSVNPQNPQQLTFTRQLVLPSGQQLLLSTGNSQSSLQGQVIISKPQGSTTDQIPKAIIILQQQKSTGNGQANSQSPSTAATTQSLQTTSVVATTVAVTQPGAASTLQQQNVTASRSTVIAPSGLKSQIVALQHPSSCGTPQIQKVQSLQTPMTNPIVASSIHHAQVPGMLPQQQQQIIHGGMGKPSTYCQFEGVRSSSYPHLTSDQLDLEFPFLCEWAGCGLRFLKPQQVSMHALKVHCPETLMDAVRCEWGQNGCDPLLRKRFSLMTHMQDRHCSKQALEMALYRRKNKIEPPPIPQQPVHHPGYAPNAAFHAIKRHAMSFMSTKEHLHDDNEGPVTKSIRLTAALILRNLVNYSGLGRRMLHGYESHLSSIAMSNVESSRTIAQLLHDMNEQPKSSK